MTVKMVSDGANNFKKYRFDVQEDGSIVDNTDNSAPVIAITDPTNKSSYTTKEQIITLSGTASDSYAIKSITYSINNGVKKSATGSNEWSIPDISLIAGDNIVLVTAYDTEGNSSSTAIDIIYNQNFEFLNDFQINPDSIFINEPCEVTIKVFIKDSDILDKSKVKILKVDGNYNPIEELGNIYDDGNVNNGDDIANDGVFSIKTTFNESELGQVLMRVKAETSLGAAYGNVAQLSVIEHISDEQIDTASEMDDNVQQKLDELLASNPEETAKEETVEWLESQPEIESAGISESGDGIWYLMSSGILGGVLDGEEGTKGRQQSDTTTQPLSPANPTFEPLRNLTELLESETSTNTVGSNKVAVLSSFANQGGVNQLPSEAYDNVYNLFDSAESQTFDASRFLDENVSVDLYKNLSDYGVVIIDSHGDAFYSQDLHSIFPELDDIFAKNYGKVIILTGEDATEEKIKTYEADLKKGRLTLIGNYFAITPAFINYYYYNDPLADSIIFSGSCRSMFNDSMADQFISAGAKTYFGYTDYVKVSYDSKILPDLFSSMLNDGLTTEQAFDNAVEINGASDGSGAYFKIKGNKNVVLNWDGLINGDFEIGNTNGWDGTGDARVISKLGELIPPQGNYMLIVSTGLGSVDDSNSIVKQTFKIPTGTTKLVYDYNVVSEEPLEYVGSEFDDKYLSTLSTVDSTYVLTSESVNSSSWIPVSDIDFYGGDHTVYQTGWKHIEYDVSSLT
ncbi:MAG: Ig-like domain-containing protein, partial [Desulfosporosinus sp.]